MSKTRKHKPSSRKIRKHKPTRKQTGGVCCRYEKAKEGQGCDGTSYKNEQKLTRTFKSPTGNQAEFENIGFEPIWFKDGHPLPVHIIASGSRGKPFFMTWKNIKFGLTYHSLKHTENLGTKCYDIENLIKVIKKMIPKLNWTRNATNKKVQSRRNRGLEPGIRKIFNHNDDFETFYNKLAEAPYCWGPKNCLYYSEDQKKADITVCNGYYILENPTPIKLEIGKREKEGKFKEEKVDLGVVEIKTHETIKKATEEKEFEVKLSKKDVNVAAIKLTFLRFLNKNQGGDPFLFKGVKKRLDYEKTLFLYKIEVLDETNWENQQKILLDGENIAKVQQVLINNASDCNKDPESRNNWIKTENGRKRNPRLFLKPWHGINVIKNTQNEPQYRELIAVAFRDMHKAITNVQTAVNYFSDPYDIFPQDDDDGNHPNTFDAQRKNDVEKWKKRQWETEKQEIEWGMQGEAASILDFENSNEHTNSDAAAIELEKNINTARIRHMAKKFDEKDNYEEFKKQTQGMSKKERQRQLALRELEKEKFKNNYFWSDEETKKIRSQVKKEAEAKVKEDKNKNKKKMEQTAKTHMRMLKNRNRKEEDEKDEKLTEGLRGFKGLRIQGSLSSIIEDTDPEPRPLSSIDGAICNNPHFKNLITLEEEKKNKLPEGKKRVDAMKKKLKAQKEKRPCWYQFLDSLEILNTKSRAWQDKNVARRFCTIFLFTGRKLIENFKNLLLGRSEEDTTRDDEDTDSDDEAEEIAKKIGEGFASNFDFANHQNEKFDKLIPKYEKFIEDNLKLINIWNTGVRWVIDILDNPCEVTKEDEDVGWKDELKDVLTLSFINYWKKVDSLCEGEIEDYPKVTEEIKKIINKDDGAKSANYLFKKEQEERRRRRELKEEEEEASEEEEESKNQRSIDATEPSLNQQETKDIDDDVKVTGVITLDDRLRTGAERATVIDGGKKTRKKKMHRTKRSNRKTKRKKRKTKRRTKRKTKRRRRKRKHKRTRKR